MSSSPANPSRERSEHRPDTTARLLARVRIPLLYLWLATLATDWFLVDLPGWLTLTATVVTLAVYFLVGTPKAPPVVLAKPVTGRWIAFNSPESRVPSHGLHAYGQTYALDLVHEPGRESRPAAGRLWPLSRPPTAFSGFGQPVFAPAGGRVVKVSDGARDHRSRRSWPAMAYLVVESAIRELLGPGRVIGNHLVIDAGAGRFVLLAHLRRRSARVSEGEEVEPGQPLAECGNSGNSTEPHLHLQAMDHANPAFAAGLPLRFAGRNGAGKSRAPVPGNGEAL